MKDNRVTTLHFSPFAAHQMYSEALYFAERDPLFFNSISRTNFLLLLPLRAKQKEQVFGLFVMFPPFASSPPIRLLYYLADVYQGREIISKTKKPVTYYPAALKTACHAQVYPCEGAATTLSAARKKKNTFTSLTHQIHSQVSYYTSAGISQKPGCLSALSRPANAAAGFCNGGGRSVP